MLKILNMIDIRRYITLTICVLLVGILNISAASIKIEADTTKIGVGEFFNIIIAAKDCPGNLELSDLPPGIKKIYQSIEDSSRYVNGKRFNSTKLTLTCKGETPGEYKFGPISIGNIKSNVLSYEVVGPDIFQNCEAFIVTELDKYSVQVNNPIIYTTTLYTSFDNVSLVEIKNNPKIDGFKVKMIGPKNPVLTPCNINGESFYKVVIAKYKLTPIKSGEFCIPGENFEIRIEGHGNINDPFFQDTDTDTSTDTVTYNLIPGHFWVDVSAPKKKNSKKRK